MTLSDPAHVPAFVADVSGADGALRTRSFRSMASTVTVQLGADATDPETSFDVVEMIFAEVERQCTRFDATSDLMRANAAGEQWQHVGGYCFGALAEAARMHVATDGLFDPRTLRSLVDLGYDRSLPIAAGPITLDGIGDSPAAAWRARWTPEFDVRTRAVRIGAEPVDLGGIGKGLAVRWAADVLREDAPTFAVDAGGDCHLAGTGPDGAGWRVGVEDPRGGSDPVAVLCVAETACATSSIRLRRWTVGGREVHHILDPRTGAPGGAGLLSVTVLAADAATAEVWSKVLFLHGADGISAAAQPRGLPALWVDENGALGTSAAMAPFVLWRAS